ncbi:MAG TPA: bifunctional 3-phosphoshikimate 1-carboxyvinyltransferase/cytidylate kinase [Zoogloea sp.]|uniref:bifunctional 3-phosphoshikimate 1-carboxyvinyltransferase/cytidylate kinase n=1 Tax=Zoogloea sp. TaxID=49181 RepID=UPI002D122B6A|nr:bifunctional 3-phosphoshikimate 1-carboxyvinyltransferase/cytidylate kinase [Zoogloea sp.]HMY48667.1 bifunctional 3-phosphoshikimate 1-carboxyvinyltransferase/cytidylate kinase [Rhodocyclaceae bacterium]HNH15486.1 bifunctional 3-phosphoshikimate 1-carboxyvinyltransferase/cytidylate kinase [Zoogloea sp.]HNI46866.1 bifunctional 3-phosphoshikimate 1-carboxyvinyltransferase/cytidylate kinase [Zoogloea sp.]
MEFIDLPPMLRAVGEVRLPGSKSISNRVLLLAALAEGTTRVEALLDSDDTRVMRDALVALGVGLQQEGDTLVVTGCGGRFPNARADLFVGNSGLSIRTLVPAVVASLAGCGDADAAVRLSGVPRMHERPIGDLVDGLAQLGARVDWLGQPGFPPLALRPAPLAAETVSVRGNVSSQFLTGLLQAAPLVARDTPLVIVVEGELISRPYVEITLNLMARFGVQVERDGWSRFVVPTGQHYVSPGRIVVEGDASTASYFLAAGALGGGPLRVKGAGRGSIQGDVRFADALAEMGAQITWGEDWIEARAPESGRLKGIDLDLNHIPDAAMTLAVAALVADGPSHLRNIGSWRVKETDRIAAMATELRKLGATVEEFPESLRITPPARLQPAVIDTYEDHRVAMCFSLATLCGTSLRINDPKCVNKTFPGYFETFAGITAPVPVVAIDGPSASGKGTVAARVAQALGFAHLDSGSLYRIVALTAIRRGVALDDEPTLAAIATDLPARFEGDRVMLEGDDVTEAIRSEACSVGASRVAALPTVREALFWRQRAYRRAPGLVGEGRDMGSVVFPDAPVKIFLTASVEARAERRYKQLMDKGMPANMADLLKDLRERDARDAQRAAAPLKQEEDAVLLDTSDMSVEQAVAFVLERAAILKG